MAVFIPGPFESLIVLIIGLATCGGPIIVGGIVFWLLYRKGEDKR